MVNSKSAVKALVPADVVNQIPICLTVQYGFTFLAMVSFSSETFRNPVKPYHYYQTTSKKRGRQASLFWCGGCLPPKKGIKKEISAANQISLPLGKNDVPSVSGKQKHFSFFYLGNAKILYNMLELFTII